MPTSEFTNPPGGDLTLVLERFEAAWSGGDPPALGDFLSEDASALSRREALLALVAVDLEYRWRSGEDSAALCLEDYVVPYPDLGLVDELPLELLVEEYRIRRRFGDRPSHQHYQERFPHHASLLERALSEVDQELVSEETTGKQGASLADTEVHDSTGSATPSTSDHPRRLGDYELLEELGKGGMGVVYKARQISAGGRLVALKLIRPDQLSQFLPEEGANVLARFRTEVEAAAKLEHDHVVTVYDVGEVDGQSYYAMRFVDGESLKDKLANGPLEPEDAARYTEQVALALAEAHSLGILHRDLKPHNVMVDAKTDRALLADFGLAKLTEGDQQLTATESAMGSPPYMSPEQAIDASKVTEASDIYGLGATFYHLLTGRPPFQAASMADTLLQVRTQDPVRPRLLNPAVPRDLETITLKCLEKVPDKRYPTAAFLAEELARYRRGEPIRARPVGAVERAWRWCKRNRGATTAIGGGLVAILLAAVTVYVLLEWSRSESRARHISQLTDKVQNALDDPAPSIGYLEQGELLLRDLDGLDAQKADAYRQRLLASFAAQVERRIRQPNLSDEQAGELRAAVDYCSARDPATAQRLLDLLDTTVAEWQQAIELTAPYSEAEAIFGKGEVVVGQDGVTRAAGAKGEESLMTLVSCRRQSRIEVEFAEGWESAHQLGVILNGSTDTGDELAEYRLILFTTAEDSPTESKTSKKSFLDVRRKGGTVTLGIKRGDVWLRRQSIAAKDLPAGPLVLRGSRDGPKLRLEAVSLASISFIDPFPSAARTAGSFGLLLPQQLKFVRLLAERRDQTQAPGSLDKVDALIVARRYSDALSQLQRLRAAAPSEASDLLAEIEYKSGLCSMELGRTDEARETFTALAVQQENAWSLSATARLWLLNVRAGDFDIAESQLQDLASRYTFDDLAESVPDGIRREIIEAYSAWYESLQPFEYSTPTDEHLRHLRRLLAVQILWRDSPDDIHWVKKMLMMSHFQRDEFKQAAEICRDLLKDQSLPPWKRFPLEEYLAWIRAVQGEAEVTLNDLESRFRSATDGEPTVETAGLAVPMARLYLQKGEPQKAKDCLSQYFKLSKRSVDAEFHLGASLVLGFAHEDLDEHDLAKEVWRSAFRWAKSVDHMEVPPAVIMGSLADDFTAEDCHAIIETVTGLGDSKFFRLLRNQFLQDKVVHSFLRRTWQTPYGRKSAREVALREVSMRGFYSRLMTVPMYEIWRQTAVDLSDSADLSYRLDDSVDFALRKLSNDYWAHIDEGRITQSHFLTGVLLRKGFATVSTWQKLYESLPDDIRGSSTYFYARRYELFGKTELAQGLFQLAIEDEQTDWRLKLDAESRLKKLDPEVIIEGRLAHRHHPGRRASWGPESRHLVRELPAQDVEGEMAKLVIIDTENGEETDLGVEGKDCAWSPASDGPIAFVKSGPQGDEVWLVDSTGENPRRIANGSRPTWSADGATIYLLDRTALRLRTVNVRGDRVALLQVRPTSAGHDLAVSPDGTLVVQISADEKHLQIRDARNLRIGVSWTLAGLNSVKANWSMDGQYVAFSGKGADGDGIWILDVTAATARRVLNGMFSNPKWSPDGKWLVFDDDTSGEVRIFAATGLDTYLLSDRPVKLAIARRDAADSPRVVEVPAQSDFALFFDGQNDHVVIPTLKYDGSRPITLEARVRPAGGTTRERTIVGNVNFAGIGIGVHTSDVWQAFWAQPKALNKNAHEYVFARASFPVKRNQWTHVSGVFNGKTMTLFVDGNRIATSDTNVHRKSDLPFFIGADPRSDLQPEQFFHGQIDQVRISSVARYIDDFEPIERLALDEKTEALYEFDQGTGNVLQDGSGNGHDGKIVGAKWIIVPSFIRR